jgi:hypothetical protein
MAKKFTLAELTAGTIEARLADYAMGMADGEVSLLVDVLQELGVSNSGSSQAAAKRAGVHFLANVPGDHGGQCALIANPNTVKQWHEAQKKVKPKQSR